MDVVLHNGKSLQPNIYFTCEFLPNWEGHINKEYKYVTISTFLYCNEKFKPYTLAYSKHEIKVIFNYENI
jgi:hypothetical protein